jgi:hypothetical protein
MNAIISCLKRMAETSTGDCGNQHSVSSLLTTEDVALAAIIYR